MAEHADRIRTMNERLVEALHLDADSRVRLHVAELGAIYADTSGGSASFNSHKSRSGS
jgi:hypothetical protein